MNKFLTHRRKLVLSISGGILVATMVYCYLKQTERRLNARFETAVVLVTRKYIPIGKEVKPEMVEEKKIPIAFIQPTAIRSLEDLKDAHGKPKCKTRIELLKGEQLTRSKLLEGEGSLGLAWNLSPDQQAISFRLNSDQAVGGHLKPGDWVSIWAAFDLQPGLTESQSLLIVPHSRVMGIQENLWDPNGGSLEKIDWKDLSSDGILVTLSIAPADCGQLILARSKGQLSLVLQSALSQQNRRRERVKFSQIIKG